MKTVQNKVIVITGASSGAGRAMAVELAKKGSKLVLAARREKALTEVAEECRSLGAAAEVVVTDTRNALDVQQLATAALEKFGTIDVWINNAGVLAAGALEDVPAEINENVIRTNLIGYIHGAREVLTHFKKRGRGIIVNNISVGGWFPSPYASAYTASKFGLRGFFESLKGELAGYPDIHIVDLYPGFLDTPGIQHSANYTGKTLKPAPPVYDPRKLAAAVIRLLHSPEPRKVVGVSSALLHLAYSLAPSLTRNLTGMFIRTYLRSADPIENTSGNVIHPVEFGSSIDGGWRNSLLPRNVKTAALLGAAMMAGIMLLKRK